MFVRACLSITQREENKAKRAKLLEEKERQKLEEKKRKKYVAPPHTCTHTFHPAAFNFSSSGKLGPLW